MAEIYKYEVWQVRYKNDRDVCPVQRLGSYLTVEEASQGVRHLSAQTTRRHYVVRYIEEGKNIILREAECQAIIPSKEIPSSGKATPKFR